MSKDIVAFEARPGLPASMEAFAKGVQNTVADLSQTAVGATPFLKLDRTGGGWMYGQEDTEVQEGSLWAMNPLSLKHGYIAWGDGEVLGERMVPISQAKPSRNELPDLGTYYDKNARREVQVTWDDQLEIGLKCMSGDDKDQEVTYKGTSHGMKQAMHKYVSELTARLGEGRGDLVAVVKLKQSSYKHKKYGTTYKPELDIVKWVGLDKQPTENELAEDENDGADTETVAAPARSPRRRPAVQEPEEAPEETAASSQEETDSSENEEEEQPVRRRRRRRAS